MHFRARFGVLLVLVLLLFFRVEAGALLLPPFLEGLLSQLFGTKVSMGELRFDPLNGHLQIKKLTILNQPEYTPRPHLRTDLEARINMRNLLTPHLHVKTLILRDAYFLIEKIRPDDTPWQQESQINIKQWIRRMGEMKRSPGSSQKTARTFQFDEILLENVAFIYEYRTTKTKVKKRYVFQNLKGSLKNFRWPVDDPARLEQTAYLEGFIGLLKPAPIWAGGRSNFSSKRLSFDVTGEIRGGSVMDYPFFLEDMPVEFTKGSYDMKGKVVCVTRQLDWQNDLVLHKMRLKSKDSASGMIWGFPIKAAMGFMERQKKIELKLSIQGDIGDPRLSTAFGQAFREALGRYATTGLGLLAEPVKIMAKTGEAVAKTGGAVAEGPVKIVGETINKVTTLVNPADKTAQQESKNG